jgi:hypothetical protein
MWLVARRRARKLRQRFAGWQKLCAYGKFFTMLASWKCNTTSSRRR